MYSVGADIHVKDNTGRTLLHIVAEHNYYDELISYLINIGADIHAKDNDSCTPL